MRVGEEVDVVAEAVGHILISRLVLVVTLAIGAPEQEP
jgi:hypothetical protein